MVTLEQAAVQCLDAMYVPNCFFNAKKKKWNEEVETHRRTNNEN